MPAGAGFPRTAFAGVYPRAGAGGSLAVKDGDQVIPVINRIAKGFLLTRLNQVEMW